ncbi:MAG TPA: hypothetical protein VMT36_05650, partial [Candidatus Saccharimonadia bacterium]|nr:hypothetical protein [Candidatus Saccharimonadia bacterium]
ERLGLSTVADLEAALRDLGTAVAMPPTPDMSAVAGARLRAAATPSALPTRTFRSVRRSLLLAAALALLLAGAALGVRFGLSLLQIEFGPAPSATASTTAPASSPPSPRASAPAGLGVALGLGTRSTFEDASANADFPILTPAELGPPDAVFRGGDTLRGQIAFVYAPRAGIPASELLGGAALLVTQNRGDVDEGLANKLVDSGLGRVERLKVGSDDGYWFFGQPHVFWYIAEDGSVVEESRRLVGNTLVWQHGDVLYRIEGDISRDAALEIATSLR